MQHEDTARLRCRSRIAVSCLEVVSRGPITRCYVIDIRRVSLRIYTRGDDTQYQFQDPRFGGSFRSKELKDVGDSQDHLSRGSAVD